MINDFPSNDWEKICIENNENLNKLNEIFNQDLNWKDYDDAFKAMVEHNVFIDDSFKSYIPIAFNIFQEYSKMYFSDKMVKMYTLSAYEIIYEYMKQIMNKDDNPSLIITYSGHDITLYNIFFKTILNVN